MLEQLWQEHPDALIVLSPMGEVQRWNPAAEALFGWSEEEAVGRALVDLVLPPDRAHEERDVLSAALTREVAMYESVRRCKDGALVHVAVSLRAVRSDTGNLEYFLLSKKNITHLKIQRAAKMLEVQYRDVFETVPDAIVLANVTGRIVLVNSQAEALFRYNKGEMIALPVEALLPSRFRAAHIDHRAGYQSVPRTRSMGAGLELFALRRDGTEFPVEISLSPLETSEGILVMSAIRDVTERKKYERAIQDASRLKSEFLASMSHELRTPLNAVIGFSEFLVDERPGPLNAKQKEYIQDILTSGRHLLQLINDVLDLSKVEAGRMDLFPEPLSLPTAIAEVCSILAPMAESRSLSVRWSVAQQIDAVTLDPQRFKQILFNLLSNAIKFTEPGGRVEIRCEPHGEDEFRLAVEDTGIGIAAEKFDRLFIEFQQLDQGFSRRYAGTGLGLALTKKLVELQGGAIAVESELGRGSTFTVILPLSSDTVQEPRPGDVSP